MTKASLIRASVATLATCSVLCAGAASAQTYSIVGVFLTPRYHPSGVDLFTTTSCSPTMSCPPQIEAPWTGEPLYINFATTNANGAWTATVSYSSSGKVVNPAVCHVTLHVTQGVNGACPTLSVTTDNPVDCGNEIQNQPSGDCNNGDFFQTAGP
ncbi:MAG TPA: hypothetical protein VK446_01050 [Methylocystis sp.]|nr:hypothetical protein [Methylocystis sp.]